MASETELLEFWLSEAMQPSETLDVTRRETTILTTCLCLLPGNAKRMTPSCLPAFGRIAQKDMQLKVTFHHTSQASAARQEKKQKMHKHSHHWCVRDTKGARTPNRARPVCTSLLPLLFLPPSQPHLSGLSTRKAFPLVHSQSTKLHQSASYDL